MFFLSSFDIFNKIITSIPPGSISIYFHKIPEHLCSLSQHKKIIIIHLIFFPYFLTRTSILHIRPDGFICFWMFMTIYFNLSYTICSIPPLICFKIFTTIFIIFRIVICIIFFFRIISKFIPSQIISFVFIQWIPPIINCFRYCFSWFFYKSIFGNFIIFIFNPIINLLFKRTIFPFIFNIVIKQFRFILKNHFVIYMEIIWTFISFKNFRCKLFYIRQCIMILFIIYNIINKSQ